MTRTNIRLQIFEYVHVVVCFTSLQINISRVLKDDFCVSISAQNMYRLFNVL